MKPILEIQNISKKFVINNKQQPYLSLRDSIANIFTAKTNKEDFWALKDISFNVEHGDTIGIIGKNGAGKSTLLKILSKITPPTSGKIVCRGRIACLLEVGTGFHSELTGRENVFMNGSILGMRHSEILKNFDAIVDFAGVEKFIDTPLKHYSSGMQLRLAFAVAAHLDPEILIVDEVLAVGDASFQKKCLGKMGEVSEKEGRTVLFVSHNLQAIQDLCSSIVVLEKGNVIEHSDTGSGIKTYMSLWQKGELDNDLNLKDRLSRCSGDVRFTSVVVQDEGRNAKWDFQSGDNIRLVFSYQVFKNIDNLMVYFALKSPINDQIVTTCKHIISEEELLFGYAENIVIDIPNNCLRQGVYSIYLVLGDTATPYTPYDVLDNNVSLPFITITSNETDPHKKVGYFSINSSLSFRESKT